MLTITPLVVYIMQSSSHHICSPCFSLLIHSIKKKKFEKYNFIFLSFSHRHPQEHCCNNLEIKEDKCQTALHVQKILGMYYVVKSFS